MPYCHLVVVLCCLGSMTAIVAWEFEDQLKAAGISPEAEAIDILVKQEFSAVGDLGSLTVESLVGMGIKHGTAQKIVANFGKQVRGLNGLPLLT